MDGRIQFVKAKFKSAPPGIGPADRPAQPGQPVANPHVTWLGFLVAFFNYHGNGNNRDAWAQR